MYIYIYINADRIAEANLSLTTSLSLKCGPSNNGVGYYWMFGTTFLNLKIVSSKSRMDIYSSLIDGGRILRVQMKVYIDAMSLLPQT